MATSSFSKPTDTSTGLDELQDPSHKFTRESLGYRDSDERCSNCINFNFAQNECSLMGDAVSPDGTCDKGYTAVGADNDVYSDDDDESDETDAEESAEFQEDEDEEMEEGADDGKQGKALTKSPAETDQERLEEREIAEGEE